MAANSEGLLNLMRMRMDMTPFDGMYAQQGEMGMGLVGGARKKFISSAEAVSIFSKSPPHEAKVLIDDLVDSYVELERLKKLYAIALGNASDKDIDKMENYLNKELMKIDRSSVKNRTAKAIKLLTEKRGIDSDEEEEELTQKELQSLGKKLKEAKGPQGLKLRQEDAKKLLEKKE